MSRNFDLLRAIPPANAGGAEAMRSVPSLSRKSAAYGNASIEDEILKLVQRTFLFDEKATSSRCIAFCGVETGTGCSWVCARAAEALAEQVPGKVCLIDANFRKPSLHAHFHLENGPGLADAILDGFVPPVHTTWISNLWLVTSGIAGAEPNALLGLDRLRAVFSRLRNEFDYLLVDTPAVSHFADAAMIGRITDGAILVVSSDTTRREAARAAKENLLAAKVSMIGAVLNRRTYPIPRAIYQRL